MEDTPFDVVSLAVEIIATIIVIGFIGLALTLATNMQKSYQREADIQVMMQEMAMYSKYDNTLVTGSDAIEAIYLYAAGDFFVYVEGASPGPCFGVRDGSYAVPGVGTVSCRWPIPTNVGTMSIVSTDYYEASVELGTNGEVIGLKFIKG